MSDEAVLIMKLVPELRGALMAKACRRPGSQVARELRREFIERQRQAREYDAFLPAEVDTARADRFRPGRQRRRRLDTRCALLRRSAGQSRWRLGVNRADIGAGAYASSVAAGPDVIGQSSRRGAPCVCARVLGFELVGAGMFDTI